MKSFSEDKLSADFYERDAVLVAKELLGKILVRKLGSKTIHSLIVETEAYRQKDDLAAHSYNGKTERNSVMFGPGGYLYVYFTYGKHFCSNVVTGIKNQGDAVLIRAVEPLDNIELLAINRFGKISENKKDIISLTNGPAKLSKALQLTKKENGLSLNGNKIYILDAELINKIEIVTTTRIGIKKSADYPWRFYIKGNKFVSKK